MMNDVVFTRKEVLEKTAAILELQEAISSFVGKRLCETCETAEEEWMEKRTHIMKHLKNLISKYDFARTLPRDDLGIAAQAVLSYLLKIQYTYAQVVVMIDMIRGEPFGEVYLDSMNAISSKTHQQLTALKNLTLERIANQEAATAALQSVVRLEREIDEDNIVICRQISVASVEGETNYTCYMMRKIVSELEHISDYIKDAAEVIIDI
ncbi:MAG: hypothetical protein ACFFDR_10860 [Candidatus Thorarchaeota archaeon]